MDVAFVLLRLVRVFVFIFCLIVVFLPRGGLMKTKFIKPKVKKRKQNGMDGGVLTKAGN